MPFKTFDIWDQGLLTEMIVRPFDGRDPAAAEDQATLLGRTIAPLKSHAGRLARVKVAELKPFGKGQLRAPDATPPLFKPSVTFTEQLIELALLDEMERIPEEEWLKLNSSDENVRRSAGAQLVDRGRILRLRNERLTEWMVWQALQGQLILTYPQGGTVVVDYGFPSGHKPVLTGTNAWTDTTNSDPVVDIQAWSEKLADDSGFFARHLHMTSKTYDLLIRNTKIKNMINFYAAGAAPIQRPRQQDLLNLFTSFAVGQDITIYDNGYRDVGATGIGRPALTRYLSDNRVLVTAPYVIDGHNIADTLDGQVSVSTGYNSTDIRQGEQAEVMLDHISKTYFFRYASARIPRVLIPEAILFAQVGT